MSAVEGEVETPAPEEDDSTTIAASDLDGLDEIHGYICDDCRLIWVGGFDPKDMGLDQDIDALSDSARAFAESAKHIRCADQESSRFFTCLICDVVSIGGYAAVAYMTP